MPEYTVIIIRSVFAFFFVLLIARILGKKQIAQMTFFDYITGITIGNIAASLAINTNIQPLNTIIGMIIFTTFSILIAFFALESLKIRQIVEGSPTTLIQDGNIIEKNLLKVRMTFDDLMMGLREKNVFKLADVESAVLETNGKISVMKKTENNPLTPKDIGLPVESEHAPSLIIMDGYVLRKRVQYLGYSEEWLLGEIKKQGAEDFKDVFLAQIDSKGNVHVDLYNEEKKPQQVKQKPLLAAQLRKMQGDLESFAIQTDDQVAKKMYLNQSKELQDLINKVIPYLKE
ncbi:DUF421 domain-containing protein [Tenuibacillus multivorans]|uniref:Uncharacterized membrane protein YcaP, DUF421 family n=1 Tax=Tenuibacillus multivorans TaxID=237069 RepID=A0A1G9ZVU4_9BACI|nr:DUF421 domain-containing protein [Tenuibacillus multivorans]GEL76879.1 DUF421 domain-containing protein [Tenuibacillus multivorans]SDN25569.1 Uncharacterized membrane protein YcaP, DUF421 family [Tenuibacillus multivorans]